MSYDIVADTKCVNNGDIFFCFSKAEKYVDITVLEKAKSIFCEKNFLSRIACNLKLSDKQINTIRYKISEKKNEKKLKKELVKQLKNRYKIPKKLIAVTGTKGKTSTCWFALQFLSNLGINCGYIGTLGAYYCNNSEKKNTNICKNENINISNKSSKTIFRLNNIVNSDSNCMYNNIAINSIDITDKIDNNCTLTTPSIDQLYRLLNAMYLKKIECVVFEVSSHSLVQERIKGLHIDCSCFTNLSQDHLDYHKTMNEYFKAKTLLFKKYQNAKDIAILNADDSRYNELHEICKKKKLNIFSFGKSNVKTKNNTAYDKNDINIISIKQANNIQYIEFENNRKNNCKHTIDNYKYKTICRDIITNNKFVRYVIKCIKNFKNIYYRCHDGESKKKDSIMNCVNNIAIETEKYTFQTSILGTFQVYNIIEAMMICNTMFNVSLEKLCDIATVIKAPLGRMQKVEQNDVFIDYSHTPKSLEESLKLLKEIYKTIIVVFGCGGNRDKQKRPIMFEIAKNIADCIIVTNDNPRTEKPNDIINDILCFEKNDISNQLFNNNFVKTEIQKIKAKYSNRYNINNINYDGNNFFIIENRKDAITFAISQYMKYIKKHKNDMRKDTNAIAKRCDKSDANIAPSNNDYYHNNDNSNVNDNLTNIMIKKNIAVLIAGKGHENYQIIEHKKIHFDDYEEALIAINKYSKKKTS